MKFTGFRQARGVHLCAWAHLHHLLSSLIHTWGWWFTLFGADAFPPLRPRGKAPPKSRGLAQRCHCVYRGAVATAPQERRGLSAHETGVTSVEIQLRPVQKQMAEYCSCIRHHVIAGAFLCRMWKFLLITSDSLFRHELLLFRRARR